MSEAHPVDFKLQERLLHLGEKTRKERLVVWVCCHHCGREHVVDTSAKLLTYICRDVTFAVAEGDEVYSTA